MSVESTESLPSRDGLSLDALLRERDVRAVEIEPELGRVYAAVDRKALSLCRAAMRDFGLFRAPGAAETWSSLSARTHLHPQAAFFVRRLLDILVEEGDLDPGDSCWRRCGPLESPVAECGACEDPILRLIERCGRSARDFILGRRRGVDVIFPHGDRGPWAAVHHRSALKRHYTALMGAVAARSIPPRARVLEIGAGTGAGTAAFLRSAGAERCERFVYTDVSRSFLRDGQAHFGERDGVEFRTLDLDAAPGECAWARGAFDLVIGANAVHVARDLLHTARLLRSFLRPGGYLVVAEGGKPDWNRVWRPDLVFGMLDGWWRVPCDPAFRPQPGFLPPRAWLALLQAAGFARAEAIPLLPGRDVHGGVLRARA